MSYVFAGALPEGISPATIQALVHPVIDAQFDLVLPSYARHKFDGLINRGVVYPLTRALYERLRDTLSGYAPTRAKTATCQKPTLRLKRRSRPALNTI